MRLVTARNGSAYSLGFVEREDFFGLKEAYEQVASGLTSPGSMNELIDAWREHQPILETCIKAAQEGSLRPTLSGNALELAAPIPVPRRNPFLVAGNYAAHVQGVVDRTDLNLKERKNAVFFTKPTTTVIGPRDPIVFSRSVTDQVDYELELAVVIGKRGRDIQPRDGMDHVFGFMICNDISARDLQIIKPQIDYLRGKGLDTFFPCGPYLVPKEFIPDYRSYAMTLSVNGEPRQSSTPAHMVRDVSELLTELSRGLTLIPGDIIATGTPSGVVLEMEEPKYLSDGDIVRSEIEHLGVMENRVEALP